MQSKLQIELNMAKKAQSQKQAANKAKQRLVADPSMGVADIQRCIKAYLEVKNP